jgi:hypothetical protein
MTWMEMELITGMGRRMHDLDVKGTHDWMESRMHDWNGEKKEGEYMTY